MTGYPYGPGERKIMEDKNTQVTDPEKDTQDQDSYEKRYKDLQAQTTKVNQENATLKDQAVKDKDLFDTIQPHIDWDSVNGKPKEVAEDGDGLVDKKTLDKTFQELKDQMSRNDMTNAFRTKYPDMVEFEDIVGTFLQKTDSRRPMEERIETAVESTKAMFKAERVKGVEESEKKKKDKVSEEAGVAGLSESGVPPVAKNEADGETYDEYIASRKKMSAKAQNLI